jgi:hypothetical protein
LDEQFISGPIEGLCGSFLPPKHQGLPARPYSPDLALRDFFFSPTIKIKLKRRRCDTVEMIQAESQKVLKALTQKDFQDSFRLWQKCSESCVRSERDFEGKSGD